MLSPSRWIFSDSMFYPKYTSEYSAFELLDSVTWNKLIYLCSLRNEYSLDICVKVLEVSVCIECRIWYGLRVEFIKDSCICADSCFFVYSKFKRYFQLTKIQLQVSALKSLEQYIIRVWFSSSGMDSTI